MSIQSGDIVTDKNSDEDDSMLVFNIAEETVGEYVYGYTMDLEPKYLSSVDSNEPYSEDDTVAETVFVSTLTERHPTVSITDTEQIAELVEANKLKSYAYPVSRLVEQE